jgi:ribosomal protein S18 acetylase RimI-like enzyme
VLSLDSLVSGNAIVSALLDRVEDAARSTGCPRITLVTPNDNLDAIRFYQRRGYRIASIDPGDLDRAKDEAVRPPYRLPRHLNPGRSEHVEEFQGCR